MRYLIVIVLLIAAESASVVSAQKDAKKYTLSGMVTDANNKPVKGAMIFIDNNKTNVVTDDKGFYRIKIKSSASTVSALLLLSGDLADAPINGREIVNLQINAVVAGTLTDQAVSGKEEEVNVGYGTTSKREMTTSVGRIDGTNPKYASYRSIYEMIAGEVPGVQVSGTKVTIQGISSINSGTDPLLVVDGIVVNSISDIRPIEVKSIEILKGPSASIYGSRGANGVIMITLMKGEMKK